MKPSSVILIVDDEPAGRETLESLLITQGHYQLAFASNGNEALQVAKETQPDLILLDVMMPGMDGFEVCRHLREDPDLCEVPVMMVTALDDHDSRVQGIEAGADDFISKPFNRTELRARVRTITRLNRYRRLLEERARFRWVVDQAADGYIILNEDNTIRYANDKACNYLYLHPEWQEDAPTLSFAQLIHNYYQCEPEQAWRDWHTNAVPEPSANTNLPPRYLVRPETATSHALWLQVEVMELPTDAQNGVLVRLHDVTTQMTRQRQMWTFHALISHKLSTPLTGLLNSLYLLQDTVKPLEPEEIKEFTSIAMDSAQRLRKQIGDIRNYVRTPDLAQPGESCHLDCLIHLITRIACDLDLNSVRILEHDDTLQDILIALSQQATEVILHQILDNAKKFHPTHSPAIEVALSSEKNDALCLCIRDDGVTLSPEQLEQAWIPYYQAEKGFSGEVVGMGLGLAMVAALLWNVGGRYRIANREPGPGIEVELIVPLKATEIS
jgi:DNA-binding response OmpR family regulator/nitrogen-specific signal transduction histidine kinase